jgi:hypothetical protein
MISIKALEFLSDLRGIMTLHDAAFAYDEFPSMYFVVDGKSLTVTSDWDVEKQDEWEISYELSPDEFQDRSH